MKAGKESKMLLGVTEDRACLLSHNEDMERCRKCQSPDLVWCPDGEWHCQKCLTEWVLIDPPDRHAWDFTCPDCGETYAVGEEYCSIWCADCVRMLFCL